jgi:putative FmdB family regulatory protein
LSEQAAFAGLQIGLLAVGVRYTEAEMPVYEFACNQCGAPVSVFVRSMSSPVNGTCGRCGSSDLRRLVSRFAVIRSSGSGGLDSLDEASLMEGFDENDPRAMAAWMRKMQREMGEDAGPEFDEMVSHLERGESLDDELADFEDGGAAQGHDGGGFDDI